MMFFPKLSRFVRIHIHLILYSACVVGVSAQTNSTSIEVRSNYEGASVFIDDRSCDGVTPAIIPDVTFGRHKITLRYTDLIRQTEYVAEDCVEVLSGFDHALQIDFKPVTVTLVCNAEKTAIYLNGNLKGEGHDLVLNHILPGTYNLRLKQSFGLTAEKKVYFPPNSNECPPECFVFGDLTVASDEWNDAEVYINGIATQKKTPATFNSLLVGEYEITLVRKKDSFKKLLIIHPNKTNTALINPITERIEEKKRLARATEERKIAAIIERSKHEYEESIKPKKKLPPLWGAYVGLNRLFIGRMSKDNNDRSGFAIGVLGCLPIHPVSYLKTEIQLCSKSHGDLKDEDGREVLGTKINISALSVNFSFNFSFHSMFWIGAGYGLDWNYKSSRIKYDGINNNDQYYKPSTVIHNLLLNAVVGMPKELFVELQFVRGFNDIIPHHPKYEKKHRMISFLLGQTF